MACRPKNPVGEIVEYGKTMDVYLARTLISELFGRSDYQTCPASVNADALSWVHR
jgi:hypothetical protein